MYDWNVYIAVKLLCDHFHCEKHYTNKIKCN